MKARNAFKNQGREKELEILWTLYFTGASPKHVRFFTNMCLVQNQETTVFVFSNNTHFVVDPTALAVRADLKIQEKIVTSFLLPVIKEVKCIPNPGFVT